MIYDLSKVKDRRWKYSILAEKGELIRKIKKIGKWLKNPVIHLISVIFKIQIDHYENIYYFSAFHHHFL